MKLFTIGDSISQGFMSGAAARTDLAYSTLIARCMGIEEYRYPTWGADGLPINMETVLRRLAEKYGTNINLVEWTFALRTVNDVIDASEDHYERGEGSADKPYAGGVDSFHNVAFQGCDVEDAWGLTATVCKQRIREISEEEGSGDDDLIAFGPNASYYRTALKVLNPSLEDKYDGYSQIDWLGHHANAEGVENLIVWLGANNALGTVIGLDIRQTTNDPERRPHTMEHAERAANEWNLWHPDDFEAGYTELLDKIDEALGRQEGDCNVFVGNVPLVTIAPLAKGVGPTTEIRRDGKRSVYYKYYTYFPFEEEDAHGGDGPCLTMQEALHIDDCIRAYNRVTKKLLAQKNDGGPIRYHLVDTCGVLESLAFKRNAGQVEHEFPEHFDYVYPRVDTKYYHADTNGRLRQGGLFGLDGVHPTAIGQGIIAHEFLKIMGKAGVEIKRDLAWPKIFKSERLYTEPIPIMHELHNKDWLAKYLIERFARGTTPSRK